MTEDDKRLKQFLNDNFHFSTLKKIGFFSKEIKKNDIHAQAKKICDFFGYKTVYEQNAHTTRAHISYDGNRPLHVNEKGELKEEPFVEEFGGWFDDFANS